MGSMNGRGVLSVLTTLIEAEVAAADGDTCGELLGLAQSARRRVDAVQAIAQPDVPPPQTSVRTRQRAAA